MQFHKYNSIENAYRTAYIDKIRYQPASSGEWVALEKVHGANFSFYTDGKEVCVAKRTSFIVGDELKSFYDCGDVLNMYHDAVLQLFKCVNERRLVRHPSLPFSGCVSRAVAPGDETEPFVKELVVYGELFGGSYPGIKSTAKHIQKGVHYCPQHMFFAFDIVTDGTRINYDMAIELFEECKMIHAKVLCRGSFDTVLKWSDEHKSDVTTIPAYFGLPDVPDNRREGHVLKPVASAYFVNGSSIMLKDKNPTFNEKQSITPSEKQEILNVSPELQRAIDTALEYVTEQRYDNVVSKIGEVSKKDVGKLIGLLSKDALEDYGKDCETTQKETLKETMKKEQLKILNKAVNSAARLVVLKRI